MHKPLLKTLLRSSVSAFMISVLIAITMAVLVRLVRWHHSGKASLTARYKSEPQIILFWHEHLFVMSSLLPRGCVVLQSPHPDGRVIARAVHFFGAKSVWGSSNRHAASSLRQMVREIQKGRSMVITPDGPRGPAHHLSMGPISLAHLTGAPITLVAWSANRYWRASSWDKMRIPQPLSRGMLKCSEPIRLKPTNSKQEREKQRQMIETELERFAQNCDQDCAQKYTPLAKTKR